MELYQSNALVADAGPLNPAYLAVSSIMSYIRVAKISKNSLHTPICIPTSIHAAFRYTLLSYRPTVRITLLHFHRK